MDFELKGCVALVTGASKNIGAGIASSLANEGVAVGIGYEKDTEAAQAICKQIRDEGGTAMAVQMQLRDEASIKESIGSVVSELGPIDILVNNAGIRPHSSLNEITPQEWDSVFAVNVRAPFVASQAVVPSMIERGWGRIICLGGVDAYLGASHRAHVIASKLAVVGLARALASETAGTGVTVNVIVPGMIDTKRGDVALYGPQPDIEERTRLIPLGRLGTIEEVADLCLFLTSRRSGYITGQEIFISGGTHPMVRR